MQRISAALKHRVARNTAALGTIQLSNALLPLLVMPYLAHTLEINEFGTFAIALALIQVCQVVTDYGFTFSSTYYISQNREIPDLVNRHIGNVLFAKTLIAALLVATLLAYDTTTKTPHSTIIYISIFAIIFQALQPNWIFQGIEKMFLVTISTLSSRAIYIILVLALVKHTNESALALSFWAGSIAVGTSISYVLLKREGFSIIRPSLRETVEVLRNGWAFFASRVAVSIYTSANTAVAGIGGSIQAAQYSICDQINKGAQSLTNPLSQAIYPYMAREKNWKIFFIATTALAVIMISLALTIEIFSTEIVNMLFGSKYENSVPILSTLLLTSIISFFGITFGYPAYAAIGNSRTPNLSVILACTAHLVGLLTLYLNDSLTALNLARLTLLTESIVAVLRVSGVATHFIKRDFYEKH